VTYPDKLEIFPLRQPPSAAVEVPGSKSITNRALVLAALSGTGCELRGALESEDTEVMVNALRALGFTLRADWPAAVIHVGKRQSERLIPRPEADLFLANSGTSMRFLTALVCLGRGRYRLDGVPRMRERPIEDLLTALRQLSVRAGSEKGHGCPPVVIESDGLKGGSVRVKGDTSSQFLSGLLLALSFTPDGGLVEVEGPLVSQPYVEMTVNMLHQNGLKVGLRSGSLVPNIVRWLPQSPVSSSYLVPGGQQAACPPAYQIEPDASAASYFFAAAAITGGRVTVLGIPEQSLQGDVGFVYVLESMGCRVERCSSGITVHGRPLSGVDVDMNAISDTVMTLAAVACCAEGPTTIRNVAHIRHKETDRLAALATELRKVGAEVTEFADGLEIVPRPLHGAIIDTYNDHRMAMSMALIGLKVPGIVIKNPGCVAKTYRGFFTDLEKLRN
jgi:3-phosphoshikimate 1-carboxyvinyltransferase